MIIEFTVIGVYLLFLLGIGFAFRKFNSNVSDYFRNGCRGTWWLVGSSSFMAAISAYTFTGASGVAYQAGWSVMIVYLANSAGFLVNYLWFAKRFRQMRATTAPEVIQKRYNPATEQFYSWFTLLMGILGTAMTLYSLAIFSSAIFGFHIQQVIIVLGVIVLVYSVAGGSWAVMATDVVQCLIMFAMTLLLAVLCLIKLGGLGGLFEQIHTQGLTAEYAIFNEPQAFNRSFTWLWAVAMFFRVIFYSNSIQSAPRYFAVKDGREAQKGALLGMILMLVGACIWFIPPMTARLFYSGAVDAVNISKPSESAFAITCLNLFPPGMVGLMVVAMFAASMSTLDTGLNRNAAIVIINVYPAVRKRFRLPEMSSQKMLFMSQVISCFFGVLGILLALTLAAVQGLGQFELVLLVGAMLGIPTSAPLFWGILFKRTPPWAAICSILSGLAGSLIVHFSPQLFAYKPAYHEQVFFISAMSALGFFITMPFAKRNRPDYNRKVDDFFNDMRTPVDFEKEVGEANDLRQLKVIGLFALAMSVFISLLAFLATDLAGVLCPLSVAVMIGLLGLGMFIAGCRSVSHRK